MQPTGAQAEYACIRSPLLHLLLDECQQLLPLLWEAHAPCRLQLVSFADLVPVQQWVWYSLGGMYGVSRPICVGMICLCMAFCLQQLLPLVHVVAQLTGETGACVALGMALLGCCMLCHKTYIVQQLC